MTKLLIMTVSAALLLAGNNAGAIPIFYTYEGDFFTGNYFQRASTELQIPAEEQPSGFTLRDRAIISFTLDSSMWGRELNGPLPGTFRIGPYDGIDTARITTDVFGAILNWSIWGLLPGLDWASGGSADGSGSDVIFSGGRDIIGNGDHAITGAAFVNYPAGSPSRWSFTTPQGVPDDGATLLLLLLGITPLLLGAAIILAKPNQTTK